MDSDLVKADMTPRFGRPEEEARAEETEQTGRRPRLRIDDRFCRRSPTASAGMRRGAEHCEQVSATVDAQCGIQFGGRHMLHQRGRPGDAGVVDQHVEPAQVTGRGVDKRLAFGGITGIGAHARMAARSERPFIDI